MIKNMVLEVAKRSKTLERLSKLIVANNVNSWYSYAHLRQVFIDNAAGSSIGKSTRLRVIEQFEHIDQEVPIATTPTDGIILAELAFSIAERCGVDGNLVECGCYAGGSAAKLSVIASVLGCQLVVFDSFEGLPDSGQSERNDYHCRREAEWVESWEGGRYAADIGVVRSNIERYGEWSHCSLVAGWFENSLKEENLPSPIILVFSDVDIASSAEQTLLGTWAHLVEGGAFVTHDSAYIKVLKQLQVSVLWEQEGRDRRPILFGAGFGICDGAPHLGYMVKGNDRRADYLKSLTVVK